MTTTRRGMRADRPRPRFLEVRGACWAALALAVTLALLVPSLTLWRDASRSLRAQVGIWPALPRAGGPTTILVAVRDPIDQAAIRGPWAQVAVAWDMVAMPMGTRPVVVHGRQDSDGTFSIPLELTMAGPWHFDVSVSTPGRPTWHGDLVVQVQPPRGTGTPTASVASVSGCTPKGDAFT